jgi:hypothetical protein
MKNSKVSTMSQSNHCCGNEGAVFIELLLITPILLLMGFWTLSFTQITRERAIAGEIAVQTAQLALLHCSDEYMVDKSLDYEPNPDIIEPNSAVAAGLTATGIPEHCLDQIKFAIESLSAVNDLPPFQVHLNIWRLPAAPATQSYTRCFRYPNTEGETDLVPIADDGQCLGADIILASNEDNTVSQSREPTLDFGKATGVPYVLLGGGSYSPLDSAQLNGFFPPTLGKRMIIHAAVFLQSEAFDLSVGGLLGAGSYEMESFGKQVVGQAII